MIWWYRCCVPSRQYWWSGITRPSFPGHRLSWTHRQSTATCYDTGRGEKALKRSTLLTTSPVPMEALGLVQILLDPGQRDAPGAGVILAASDLVAKRVEGRERERERTCFWKAGMPITALFSPVSGCQFLCYFFLSHLIPATGSFFFFFLFLSILFFSICALLKLSPSFQTVVLLASSWNKIILNRKALLGAQTGIKQTSFKKNIHKPSQTSCTANVSFLIHVHILTIYFQGRIHAAL